MKHKIGLVAYPEQVHAWVLDLPGCIAGGRSFSEAEAKIPLVIAGYVGWLRAHGEAVESPGGWEIVETVESPVGDFMFEAERAPLSRHELDALIRRTEFARAGLLAAVADVPDTVLDWEPPRSAFASFDAWAPEVRTIRGVFEHVLRFEAYYRDGLRDGRAAGIAERVGDPLSERARTVERLRALTDEVRRRVWRPVRPGQSTAEEWTVRKVVRRIISHERAHAAEIVQRRTWVLLGVPTSVEL